MASNTPPLSPVLCLVLVFWPLLAFSSPATDSTITITISPSASPTSPSYTSPSALQSSILNSTNTYRYQHSVPAVTWNDTLSIIAQRYSAGCHFAHSGTPGLGENLAMGYPDISSAVDGWGSERVNYSWSAPGFSEATGHFTQLVWKSTRSTGCGATDCNGRNGVGGWLVVCEYWPQGNVIASSSGTSSSSSSSGPKTNQGGAGGGGGAAKYFVQNVPPQAHDDAMPQGWQQTATAPPPTSTTDAGNGNGVQVSPAATVTVGVKNQGAAALTASRRYATGGFWAAVLGVLAVSVWMVGV